MVSSIGSQVIDRLGQIKSSYFGQKAAYAAAGTLTLGAGYFFGPLAGLLSAGSAIAMHTYSRWNAPSQPADSAPATTLTLEPPPSPTAEPARSGLAEEVAEGAIDRSPDPEEAEEEYEGSLEREDSAIGEASDQGAAASGDDSSDDHETARTEEMIGPNDREAVADSAIHETALAAIAVAVAPEEAAHEAARSSTPVADLPAQTALVATEAAGSADQTALVPTAVADSPAHGTGSAPVAIPQPPARLVLRKYESGLARFCGWVMYCFDTALKVQDGNQTYYVAISDLANRICSKPPENALKIHRLMLEILNPMRKDVVTVEQIEELRKEGPFDQLSDERIDSLRTRHVERLPFDRLVERLKPGDLIFKKMPDDSDHMVVWGQRAFQWIIPGRKEREASKFSHVAIYLGNGKIAEAVPQKNGCDVRTLSISDERFKLHDGIRYQIVRPVDEELGKAAARIAGQVAPNVPENTNLETNHKYSRYRAGLSVLRNSSFGPFGRQRYVRGYDDKAKDQIAKDYFTVKQFFCSNFASYCYQVAESEKIMPAIIKGKTSPDVPVPIVKSVWRNGWSRFNALKYWSEMSEHVKMKFDAKHMTPQDLRNFIKRNPDQFTDLYLVSEKPINAE